MAQKTAPKKKAVKNTAQGKKIIADEAKTAKNRQIAAIVLFAISVFLLCLTLIPGGNVWAGAQSVIFGLFGFCAYIIPLILLYVAIMETLDKPTGSITSKVIEAVILVILICSAIYVFTQEVPYPGYGEGIKSAYKLGKATYNGGAFGAIFGGALLKMFDSKAAAGVTVCLLMFVDLMFITSTTLKTLMQSAWKPVQKASEATGAKIEQIQTQREEKLKARFDPNVDLGPEPDAPSKIDIGIDGLNENPESKNEKVSKPADNKTANLDDIINKNINKPQKMPEPTKTETHSGAVPAAGNGHYTLPPISCLTAVSASASSVTGNELKNNAKKLVAVLKSFGVDTRIVDISKGPSVTRYELAPAPGVKISKITGLSDDIALNMAAAGVRIEAPIPGKAAIGIEIPNSTRETVTLREIIEDSSFKNAKSKINVALGRDIAGKAICTDISKMPHLLIAGTTGSGKSVCLNAMILSILYNASPDEVKLVMIDPKQVEFTVYNGIPHLLVPVVSDPRKASGTLTWAVGEMLKRYKLFSENNVRDINGYNQLCKNDDTLEKMPQVVIFIDELADLMMVAPTEVEDAITRLAQLARAAGMHLVVATQRPSADVITGLIKANIPSRIALSVSSQVDSRIILDMSGAEKLLGNGDMLFCPIGSSKPTRIQGCFISDKDVENVVGYIKKQGEADYSEEICAEIDKQSQNVGVKKTGGSTEPSGDDDSDALLKDAIGVVVDNGQASTTLLQRKLKVGYARAARIMDELEERSIVGPYEGSKPRKVLITKAQWLEMNAMASDESVKPEQEG